MKEHFHISIVIAGIALVLGVVGQLAFGGGVETFFIAFGTICCLGGVLSLIIAAIAGLAGKGNSARSFLIAAGITLLVGAGVCSSMVL
jgi:hypothetical protein